MEPALPSITHATPVPPTPLCRHFAWMIMRHRSRDAFFTPTLRQTTPLGEDTLNFQQKIARQFDGNVVFSRYLATIFAAFVRGSHNAAILADNSRQSSKYRQSRMSPIARIALDRVSARLRAKAARSCGEFQGEAPAQCRHWPRWPRCGAASDLSSTVRAYFSAHREVMPKARHANSVSF